MDVFFKIKQEKVKYLIAFSVTLMLFIAIVSHYRNEEVPINKKDIITYRDTDVQIIKEFFFSKINSPFLYDNYEIKKGDNMQKILKLYKIKKNEIQNTIQQYKNYVSS